MEITENIELLIKQFYWPFLRIGSAIMVLPFFSSRMISMRIKLTITLVLTLFSMPFVTVPDGNIISLDGFMTAFRQIAIGVLFGVVMQMAFQAVIVAGELISMSMGLGFAQMVDPSNGINVPLLSQFFLTLITLFYLSIDGHLLCIQWLVHSFSIIPFSQELNPEFFLEMAMGAAFIFSGAFIIALPTVTTLLSINIILGVMSRASPQLNIFSVGFPVTILIGFIALLMSMPSIFNGFQYIVENRINIMLQLTTN